jgi:UDP-3-O-[3-hydroxymyristoyl] N-acetylglucosamine deacetylase
VSFQTTLSGVMTFNGVGLHSGERVRLTLRPAPADMGVAFRRIDLPAGDDGEANFIRLSPDAVVETRLGTTISNRFGARVQTVEHLLAAIVGVGLDNVIVEVEGPETPAMDGSAAPFARALARAGVDRLAAPRRVIRVVKAVEVELGGRRARFEPAPRTEIDVAIDFPDPAIGRQRAVFALDLDRQDERVANDRFMQDLAPARTFAFLAEVEALRAAGLARGGSYENCVVLDGGAVLNADGLRYADEFARHKALDALGDLAVAGRLILGRYTAERPGHEINNLALRALMNDPTAWRLETLPGSDSLRGRPTARIGGLRSATA